MAKKVAKKNPVASNYICIYPRERKNKEKIETFRKEALEAAQNGLCYSDDVVKALKEAASVNEIHRIMCNARKAM